jgi:PAS domain S-box-containing protein
MSVSKPSKTNYKSEHSKNISVETKSSSAYLKIHKQNTNSGGNEAEFLFKNTSDAIRVINSDFTICRINRAFAEMTGVDQNEVMGKKCWEVFPSLHCHTTECRLQRILDGELGIQVEIERKRKDSTSIPCLVTTFPLTDETDKLTGIIEQFRDITEKRRLEEKVEESEDRYRAMIDVGTEAGEAIVMLQDVNGKEGIQTFVSDQWPNITGYTGAELLGMSFFDLVSPVDRMTSVERHRLAMSGLSIPKTFEMAVICKNGVETTTEITNTVSKNKGVPTNILYIRDITPRKIAEKQLMESEKKYRSLFDNAPVGLWEIDYAQCKPCFDALRSRGISDFEAYFNTHPDDAIRCARLSKNIDTNKALLDLFGAPDTKGLGSSLASEIKKHPEHMASHTRLMAALAEGKKHFEYEHYLPTLDGKWIYVHVKVSVMLGHEYTLARIFLSITDITKRKIAEEEVNAYKEHLEEMVNMRTSELDKAKQALEMLYSSEQKMRKKLETQIDQRIEFTRALVHELKTPLTPILTATEILNQKASDQSLKNVTETIYGGAVALNKRIDELLDIARGEIGMLKLNIKPCNIDNLIREVVQYMSYMFKSRRQAFSLEMPDCIACLGDIEIDSQRIKQVLQNLLANASKYTSKGGHIILRVSQSNRDLVVEVEDNGLGISPREQSKLFIPYHTLSNKNHSINGIGLGLALSKMLVDLHGGKIWVHSVGKGKGSRFGFSLPL